MFRSSSLEPVGAMLYPWLHGAMAEEGLSITESACANPPARNIKPCRIGQHRFSGSHPIREMCRCKYRGFRRMIRYLTIDSLVARPVEDGPRPVQFRPLCSFYLAVGTRSGCAAPFSPTPSVREGNIFRCRKKLGEVLSSL
jgi:hypothetical protein